MAAVVPGTLVHTDEYAIYARGEYARDEDGDGFCEVHVNTIEDFWSLLLLVATAPGHLAGQAAALSRLPISRLQLFRWTWNPPLTGIGIYLRILGMLVVWL